MKRTTLLFLALSLLGTACTLERNDSEPQVAPPTPSSEPSSPSAGEADAWEPIRATLRQFEELQEMYLDSHGVYASGVMQLDSVGMIDAPEDLILAWTTPAAGAEYGYTVTARRNGTAQQCALRVGSEGPGRPEHDGLIHCQ